MTSRSSNPKTRGLSTFALALAAVLAIPTTAYADIWRGHNIGGKILDEYYAASAANGQSAEQYFGDAIIPESNAANGGRFQKFASNNAIYWHPLVSGGRANQVGGAIRDRWGQTKGAVEGYEWGPLKYPTTREWSTKPSSVSNVRGRGNHFEGGSIYWSNETGAWAVWGLIKEKWWAVGAETSGYGLPVGPEVSNGRGGWEQRFEHGRIVVYPAPGGNYNRTAAVSYSDDWALKRNDQFPEEDNDCTNFISQALYNGGIPTAGARVGRDGYNSRTDLNRWYWYDFLGRRGSYTWGAANHLRNYLTNPNIDGKTVGYDRGSTNSYVDKTSPLDPFGLQAGDVLFYNWGSGLGISHAMFVAGIGTPNTDTNNGGTADGVGHSSATLVNTHTTDAKRRYWSSSPELSPEWRNATIYGVQISPH